MDDFSEFMGWVNVVLFALIVVLGLFLRFGKPTEPRKAVTSAHRIFTVLAVSSVLAHYFLVEDRTLILNLLVMVVLLLPVLAFVLKRMKKLKWAINLKLAAVPVLVIGIWVGHLTVVEAENGHEKTFFHQEEREED